MLKTFLKKNLILILLLSNLFFFFFGFYNNENAAGAGDYFGDIIAIWKNQNLFINKTILEAISNDSYFDSRPPTAYIMHKYLNFYFYDLESYRKSVFTISILLPLFFSIFLKNKFNKSYLICIFCSSIILLSPYFRTSAYWALEENYGLIFLILNSIALFYFKIKKSFSVIILICILSSLSFYFDQKLLIIPLLSFFYLFSSNFLSFKNKVYLVLIYFFFAIPYIYLMYIWGGIAPLVAKERTTAFNWQNLGFIISIISFYVFPFLISQKNLFSKLKIFFSIKQNIILIILFLIYVLFFFIFSDQFQEVKIGNGIIYKAVCFLSKDPLYRKLLFSLSLLLSLLIILMYFTFLYDRIIILFFILLGLILNPIYQEYFDPLIFILMFTTFKEKIELNYRIILLLFFYNIFLLTGSIIYHDKSL